MEDTLEQKAIALKIELLEESLYLYRSIFSALSFNVNQVIVDVYRAPNDGTDNFKISANLRIKLIDLLNAAKEFDNLKQLSSTCADNVMRLDYNKKIISKL